MTTIRSLIRVIGVLFCVFCMVALIGYNPLDAGFSHTGSSVVHNTTGPVGAWLADLLLQLFGYGAWGVALLAGMLVMHLAGRKLGGWLAVTATGSLYWIVLCAIALIAPGSARSFFPPGGLVGVLSADTLTSIVGPGGAWILLVTVALVAVTIVAKIDWEIAAEGMFRSVESGLPKLAVVGGAAIQRTGGAIRGMSGRVGGRIRLLRTSARKKQSDDPWDVMPSKEDLLQMAEPDAAAKASRNEFVEPSAVGLGLADHDAICEPTIQRAVVPVVIPKEQVESGCEPQDVARPTAHADRALVEVEWDESDESKEPEQVVAAENAATEEQRDTWSDMMMPEKQQEPPVSAAVPPVVSPKKKKKKKQKQDVVEQNDVPPVRVVTNGPVSLASQSDGLVEVTPGALESGGEVAEGLAVIEHDPGCIFELPHLGLLDAHKRDVAEVDTEYLQNLAQKLEEKLADFGVKGECSAIRPGPVVTTFEYLPAPGIKISKIVSLSDDIAMALKALRVRIVAPIPGKGVVGIEIPSKNRLTVWIRDLLAGENFRNPDNALPLALGKDVEGKPYIADLAKLTHLLVGGTTGSGKSVGINTMLLSLLFSHTPEELRLILIDPKMLEFEMYQDIPHLLHPVVTDPRLASAALKWACIEMDRRYELLSRFRTRNISFFNKKVKEELEDWTPEKARSYAPDDLEDGELPPPPEALPYIVVVIDELADLMMVAAKDVEQSIIRLAQKARAAGIHLVLATQSPRADVITPLIRSNMPSRMAFQVRTSTDSRIILGDAGAERLLGKGDMLFSPPGVSEVVRVHSGFCGDEEVRRVTDMLREQADPVYEARIEAPPEDSGMDAEEYDELYDHAVAFVSSAGKASTSMVQRQFKIGYNRAARIVEVMEREGVVGPADGARPRQILVAHHGG